MLELKVLWPISAISKTYNRAHNVLQVVDISPNVFFHKKWNETWLLLIKIVNTSWLLICQTTSYLRKSQNSMELCSSVQFSYQNENVVNTSKKLLKNTYWTFFLLLHCKLSLASIWNACHNAKLGWNGLKESIHYHRF